MTSHYANGKRREYAVRDDLTAHGWKLVSQSGGSKGAADLVMAHPDHGLALVQVGSKSKALGPAGRARLCDLADLCSALPLLAIVVPRQPIRYFNVTRGLPRTWTEWGTL